jgi:pyruvate,orthophosphate dikinase
VVESSAAPLPLFHLSFYACEGEHSCPCLNPTPSPCRLTPMLPNHSSCKTLVYLITRNLTHAYLPHTYSPGMHKTMIVGMNDSVVDQLTMLYSRRIALRMYCQFLLSFGTNIYGLSMEQYNAVLIRLRKTTGHSNVWTVEDYEVMVKEFKALQSVSDDVWVQLHLVIAQVYTSWYGEKAILFRKALDFSEELGTAVIIQEMIVGDSGVLSTRDPSGHDQEITGYVIKSSTDRKISLQEHYMNDFKYRDQFTKIKSEVEWMFKDMMGVSFTIDLEEEVHLVQCKPGYRDAKGAVKIAYHMADEHVITERQALMQVDPLKLEYYLRDHLEPEDMKEFRDHIVIVRGDVVARSGCVSGQVCFGSEELLRLEPNTMILVKDDCTLADADAIKASVGVITVDGDISSDTATLCRGLGKPCLVHATPLTFEVDSRGIITGMMCDKYRIHTGDLIFLDSNNGDVKLAFHHPVFASNDLDLRALLKWSDDVRRIRVYAFAESCSEATFGTNIL